MIFYRVQQFFASDPPTIDRRGPAAAGAHLVLRQALPQDIGYRRDRKAAERSYFGAGTRNCEYTQPSVPLTVTWLHEPLVPVTVTLVP